MSQSKLSLDYIAPVQYFVTAARKVPSTDRDRDVHRRQCQAQVEECQHPGSIRSSCAGKMSGKDRLEGPERNIQADKVGCGFKDGKACKNKERKNGEAIRIV